MNQEQLKAALGADTILTEENIGQLAEMFTAEALRQKVELAEAHAAELATLTEANAAAVTAAVESANARLDECVELAVEAALQEHAKSFVDADTVARTVAAFNTIKEAFEKNGFVLQEDAALTEAQTKLASAETEYKNLFEKFTAVKGQLEATAAELELAKRSIIFESQTAGLADTTKEKVGALAEAVTFDSLDEFTAGLRIIVEQAKAKDDAAFNKDDKDGDDKDGDDKDGKDGKKKTMNESHAAPVRKPLHQMTSAERVAHWAKTAK